MKFENYTRDELEKCGKAFQAEFANLGFESVRDWTQAVFEWFSKTRADGVRVFCHPHDSEFLVDLCHTTYPEHDKPNETKSERWKRALDENRCKVQLAMECEWGRFNNENESLFMILEDAWKLAVIRAKVKVMIFSSQAGRDRDEITKRLGQLHYSSEDVVDWLWIDVPWRVKITGIDWGLLPVGR
ncbi:MAG: hypothetical protein ABSH22_15345 [Tepidisphaeraceae bacterium]|jgi:hypothetical protein